MVNIPIHGPDDEADGHGHEKSSHNGPKKRNWWDYFGKREDRQRAEQQRLREKFNTCSFCHRTADQIAKQAMERMRDEAKKDGPGDSFIIDGTGLFHSEDGDSAICNECLDGFHEELEGERDEMLEQASEYAQMNGLPAPMITGAAARFAQHAGEGFVSPDVKIPLPTEIKKQLDEYVLGQEDLKMTLAVAVVNHYERVKQRESGKVQEGDAELEKANILIVGPTGTGKTHSVETVARQLNVPFAKWDATTLTSAGYVGDHPEDIIQALLESAGGDVKRAEHGIVFIDEIDKKMRKSGGLNDLDVGGSGAQQSLLKLLEGSTIEVSVPIPGAPPMFRRPVKINTKDILFVTGGAFTSLKEVLFERMQKAQGSTIGFGAEMRGKQLTVDDMDISRATEKDFAAAGMLPELVGRLQIRTHTDALTVEDLKRIMTEPKNAVLKQFQTLFRNKETGPVELEFRDDALEEISKRAAASGTGARALRHILENVLKRAMFEVPSMPDVGKVVVTKETVTNGVAPLYLPRATFVPATAPAPGVTIN